MTHVFEKAGLGIAPFRFVGMYESRGPIDMGNGVTVGAPGQPMGTCDYCGQGIAICCTIQDANGIRFTVGSDCVNKVGDAGMRTKVRAEVAKRTKGRELDRIDAARARLETDNELRARLDAIPAQYGTKLEWAEWMMRHAGHTGRMKVTRYIEQA